MAKKSMILKQQAPAKFSTRKYNRCKLCGRPPASPRVTPAAAVSASARWLTRARFPASARLPGKIFPLYFVGSARRTQSTPSPRRLV